MSAGPQRLRLVPVVSERICAAAFGQEAHVRVRKHEVTAAGIVTGKSDLGGIMEDGNGRQPPIDAVVGVIKAGGWR